MDPAGGTQQAKELPFDFAYVYHLVICLVDVRLLGAGVFVGLEAELSAQFMVLCSEGCGLGSHNKPESTLAKVSTIDRH